MSQWTELPYWCSFRFHMLCHCASMLLLLIIFTDFPFDHICVRIYISGLPLCMPVFCLCCDVHCQYCHGFYSHKPVYMLVFTDIHWFWMHMHCHCLVCIYICSTMLLPSTPDHIYPHLYGSSLPYRLSSVLLLWSHVCLHVLNAILISYIPMCIYHAPCHVFDPVHIYIYIKEFTAQHFWLCASR